MKPGPVQVLPPPVHSGDTLQHQQARPWRPADLLDVWEQGRVQGPAPRALTLLASGFPGADAETLADLPIGQRDALLLELRERSFGPLAECVAACPACRETVEFTVRLRDLHTAAPARAHGEIEWQGARLLVRPPTTRDQLAVAGLDDPQAIVRDLLRRCAAYVDEAPGTTPETLPPDAVDLVSAEIARLDPGADLRFTMACPACHASWTSPFDAGSYLWQEVDAAARSLLVEVHALASAHGWSEAAILGLSPARRRLYLEMTGTR